MVKRTVRERHLIPFIIGLGIFWIANAEAANEQRCNELGANCICSEPLNTTTYTQDTSSYFNPADTTSSDKQCSMLLSIGGTAIADGSGFRYSVATSGEMFSALPKIDPSITRILRTLDGGGGQFLGEYFPASAPTKRQAFRFYMYYSPTFTLTSGSCLNSGKILEVGNEPSPLLTMSNSSGNYQIYGWTGWNTSADCCIRGPSTSNAWGLYTEGNIQGKWFRYEVVVTNTLLLDPAPTVIKVYMKNVTNNTAEVTVIDTSVPTTQPVGDSWTSTLATTLKPIAGDIKQLYIDSFRNGSCGGYLGFSHHLAAAWSTDAGQRIGAAREIEGIPEPSNLRLIQ